MMDKIKILNQEVQLTKISDDKFNGNHPNGIVEGTVRIGIAMTDVEVGSFVALYRPLASLFMTSEVIEIISESEFKTENSTYKVEVITPLQG